MKHDILDDFESPSLLANMVALHTIVMEPPLGVSIGLFFFQTFQRLHNWSNDSHRKIKTAGIHDCKMPETMRLHLAQLVRIEPVRNHMEF